MEESKKYICACGKEFKSSQSINAHKGHCKTWLSILGKEDEYSKLSKQRSLKAGKKLSEAAKTRREANRLKWISDQHTCEVCGKVMTEYYGSGRFCSKSCSSKYATMNMSENSNRKRIESLRRNREAKSNSKEFSNHRKRICTICNKEFRSNRYEICPNCRDRIKYERKLESDYNRIISKPFVKTIIVNILIVLISLQYQSILNL